VTPCIVINSYNKTKYMHWFLKFIFGIKLYMFRIVPLSIIRRFVTVHTAIHTGLLIACERDQDGTSWSCSQAETLTCMTYTIAVCTVKNSWWWTEELSETCFIPKINLRNFTHLVGFVVRNELSVTQKKQKRKTCWYCNTTIFFTSYKLTVE